MSDSKIQLSEEEMLLVQNSGWILTKHSVIDKVYRLFGNLSERMQELLQQQEHILPAAIMQSSPKISKGEQYERLPYVVLDYPRIFSTDNVLAIRTFFWWGNYFSCTLHLKGKFQETYCENIFHALQLEAWKDCYLSMDGHEFNFNLGSETYKNISHHLTMEQLRKASFIKISYKNSFADWNIADEKLLQAFRRFIAVIVC
jgi:hypothetical protein